MSASVTQRVFWQNHHSFNIARITICVVITTTSVFTHKSIVIKEENKLMQNSWVFSFFCRHVDLNCCNLWRNLTRQRHNQTEALTTTLQRLTHLLPCPCSFSPTDGMQCNDHKTCCNPYVYHCIACKISPEDDKNAVKVTMVFAEITARLLIAMAQFYTNTWFCSTHGRLSNVCKISLKIEKFAVKFTILLVWMNIAGYLTDIFPFKTNTGVCNDQIFQLINFLL